MNDVMVECPNHGGGFDCSPFCYVCGGNQEIAKTDQLPCYYCGTKIDYDIWVEELGMCIPCSSKYYDESLDND